MTKIIIAAMTSERVIGKNGTMPWHISDDLRMFKALTTGKPVIMGKNTYASLGKPLPNRYNLVVSSSMNPSPGIELCRNLEEALEKAEADKKEVFIIGGASIYRQALPLADRLYISHIKKSYEGDTYFPEFDLKDWEVREQREFLEFTWKNYLKIR